MNAKKLTLASAPTTPDTLFRRRSRAFNHRAKQPYLMLR
jgi:hypothetical protein